MASTENGDVESVSRPVKANEVGESAFGETNGLLKRFIVSSTQEMWKDEGFLLVVHAYLESNKRSLEFYAAAEAYLKGLTEMLMIMTYVIELYDREEANEPRKYSRSNSRMLGDLLEFKAKGGDALGEAFVKIVRSMYEPEGGMDYATVLEELQRAEAAIGATSEASLCTTYYAADKERSVLNLTSTFHKTQLEEKMTRIKKWKIASNIMFGIGFFTVPILTALVMVVPVPSSIEVLVGAFSATIGSVGKWCSYLLNKRENEAESQKNGVDLIERVHNQFVGTIDSMNFLVKKTLEASSSLPSMADFMKKVEQMDGKWMERIRKTVIDSSRSAKLASGYADLYNTIITVANQEASARMGTCAASTSTSKPRSWMGIFM